MAKERVSLSRSLRVGPSKIIGGASVVLLLCCLTMCAGRAWGQATATIQGVVSDDSGAAIPGAQVTATQTATGLTRSTKTDATGYYRLPALPVGTYTIEASRTDFQKTVVSGINVTVDQYAQVNVAMQLGTVQQTVTVTAAPPLVDTSTATLGSLVGRQQVQDLPLNGRHFLQLADLVPGVVSSPQGTTQNLYNVGGGYIGFSVSGQRDSYNNFTLDGISIVDPTYNTITVGPSVDAIQEFKIVANGYSPQYGLVPGAQVDIVTRSGTNGFHGSAFEYFRNSALDAKNFFDLPGEIPPYRQNQFGGTAGGPIKKDKAFFFFSYEGLRVRQSLTQLTLVPTLAMHEGNLSGVNPGTGEPFPQVYNTDGVPFLNNQVPVADFNPMAAAILDRVPLPNITGALPGQYNYDAVGQHSLNDDEFLGRIDYQLTNNTLAFVRYVQDKNSQTQPFPARFSAALPSPQGFGDSFGAMGRNIGVELNSTLSPRLANVFRFGFDSLHALGQSENIDSNFLSSVGISRPTPTLNFGIPEILIPGFGEMGDADEFQPNLRRNSTVQFTDDLTFTQGKFTHQFGGDYRLYHTHGVVDTWSQGEFTFGNELLGFGQVMTGSGFSDFLLDRPRLAIVQLGVGLGSYRWNYLGGYYSGQYRATRTFTFDFGLRYEFDTSATPIDGTITSILDLPKNVIVLASQNCTMPSLNDPLTQYFITSFGTRFATNCQLGLPASTNPSYYHGFAPRVGFAWDALGNSRVVVRGGFGIFNNFQERGYTAESNRLGPPFAPTVASFQNALFDPALPPLTYENTFTTGGPPGAASAPSTAGVPPGVRPGYVEQWTTSVQSQVSKNTMLEATYVGSHGLHLNGFILTDQNYPNSPTMMGGFPPNPAYGESYQEYSGYKSWYNGGTLQLQRRLSAGLTFTAAYTYSRSEDTISTFSGGPTDAPVPQNSYDVAANKALSNFDMRNRFVFSYLYALPFGSNQRFVQHGILGTVLSNWQWGGVLTLESGQPFTVQLPANVSGIASSGADRPNCVGNPNVGAPHTIEEWFNTAAFAPNTVITPTGGSPYELLGTCGRNIVDGPGLKNFDTSLLKDIPIHETHSLQFRAEFFNFLNHPNFNVPNRYFGTSTFASIDSAQFPRQIQFALRYAF
jgi:Carboxypeptidase regulatory-like domain